jgi:hypothetical protein
MNYFNETTQWYIPEGSHLQAISSFDLLLIHGMFKKQHFETVLDNAVRIVS